MSSLEVGDPLVAGADDGGNDVVCAREVVVVDGAVTAIVLSTRAFEPTILVSSPSVPGPTGTQVT